MLTVGVLEPGRENSGIRRYGQVLAAALGEQGARTVEATITPVGQGRAAVADALRVRAALKGTDCAVIPYTRSNIWTRGGLRLVQLAIVHLGLRRRTLTVLHDVYAPGGPNRLEWWVLSLLMLVSGEVVVHSEDERRQLRAIPAGARARVIPHFIVGRELDRDSAREQLGVADTDSVLMMVGWMNPRKNYELAIEALALLPERFILWIVGGAGLGLDSYERSLRELAHARGVTQRLTITGSVPEAELERRLAAADMGVCPYRRISASGSISTLLGARVPIVATGLPFTYELQAVAPEVVATVEQLDASALARAVAEMALQTVAHAAFEPIIERRSPSETARRYLALLTRLAPVDQR